MNSAPTSRLLTFSTLLTVSATLLCLSSCASNEELEDRLEKRNDNYSNLQKRREMRLDARQERTDEWFDRVMH